MVTYIYLLKRKAQPKTLVLLPGKDRVLFFLSRGTLYNSGVNLRDEGDLTQNDLLDPCHRRTSSCVLTGCAMQMQPEVVLQCKWDARAMSVGENETSARHLDIHGRGKWEPRPCLDASQIPSFFTLSPLHQFLAACMEY